ncbi:PaaI family thioesterase [Spirillospora sp. CA-294931]|uniref:PaaI family thioesterase n=1 Tax=Spirillospora sp. CA-294931 TaxID=3240042 RepID=UPI003D92FF4D
MSVDAEAAELWNTLSGAELIRAMADGRFPSVSEVDEHLGQSVVGAEDGLVELAWAPSERLCNPAGIVHGGYIAMVLDNAVCMAGASTCEHFMPMFTLNLNIEYLRAVKAGEKYTAVGTCVHAGRTRMVANAVISDSRGKPVAQASAAVLPNQAFAR